MVPGTSVLGTLDATPKFPNILVSLQGNTEIPGVSREVPYSVLKCETLLDTLDATAKVPDTLGSLEGISELGLRGGGH